MAQAARPPSKSSQTALDFSVSSATQRRARGYAIQPGWRLLMHDLAISPEAVLRRAHLPADILARSDTSLSSAEYFAMWLAIEAEVKAMSSVIASSTSPSRAGARATQQSLPDAPVPLRIAEALSADWFDPVLFSALCSADLVGALNRIAKYKALICPMRLEVETTARRTTLTLHWIEPGATPPPVLVGFELAFFVQLARMATRVAIQPLSVTSPTELEPRSAYEAFLGVPISRGTAPRVVFDAHDARRPFLTVNPGLWSYFEPALRQRLSDLGAHARITERLRCALLEALPAGEVSMHALGSKLGLSTRTLQRRLKEEGTSFQRTLDEVRTELARHYLKNSSMSGAEISFLLGFEDPNSFFRAFQRWTGKTPREAQPTWQ